MKRLFFGAFLIAILFWSCNKSAKQETVNKMADEMCKAMEVWDKSNPMSLIEATSAMTNIRENSEEYTKVTKEQLLSTMKQKCPGGAEKLIELYKEN